MLPVLPLGFVQRTPGPAAGKPTLSVSQVSRSKEYTKDENSNKVKPLLHQNLRQGDKASDLPLGDPHGDLYTNQSIINSEKG